MATFSNQATLTYGGNSVESNIVYGELLETLTAAKTAVEGSYASGGLVTYVVTLRNTGAAALTGLTITDDLGGYTFGTGTVYPLTYEASTAALFVGGVQQPAPAVTAGPPLVISGITVPAGTDAFVVYQARVNGYADPGAEGTITNTVTITGGGLVSDVTASQTVPADQDAELSITKSITPSQVTDNDRVTYTFLIRNSGNTAVVSTDNAAITDTFDPILTALTVSFGGAVWTQGVQYNYDPATGVFTTVPGQILVPGAASEQDPATGLYTVTPGEATLTVTGTI